jgi:hypothetical protein
MAATLAGRPLGAHFGPDGERILLRIELRERYPSGHASLVAVSGARLIFDVADFGSRKRRQVHAWIVDEPAAPTDRGTVRAGDAPAPSFRVGPQSAQQSTPPPSLPGLVTSSASPKSSGHDHGAGSAEHVSYDVTVSAPQAVSAPPSEPHPNRSLAVAMLCAHPTAQLELLQTVGSVSTPSAH